MADMPPLPELVVTVPSSSDPRQQVRAEPDGRLRLGGVASGKAEGGEVGGAQITLRFDEVQIAVSVRAGMTPAQTAALLDRAMPRGYRLSSRTLGDELLLEIVRHPVSARPPVPAERRRAENVPVVRAEQVSAVAG